MMAEEVRPGERELVGKRRARDKGGHCAGRSNILSRFHGIKYNRGLVQSIESAENRSWCFVVGADEARLRVEKFEVSPKASRVARRNTMCRRSSSNLNN